MMLETIPNALPSVRSGAAARARGDHAGALGECARYPDLAESGLPNFEVGSWTGLFVPAGTPRAIIDAAERGDGAHRARPGLSRAAQDHGHRCRQFHARGVRRLHAQGYRQLDRGGAALRRARPTEARSDC